ncbi:MAG TPA: hypothetical protein VFG69_08865 [Nannocystaceae bacterium]|nr:hypothetical protein [Nannocystaceae bacterium]
MTATPSASVLDSAAVRADALALALDDAWRWATAPLADADVVAADLAALAERFELPLGSLRALVRATLGEESGLLPEDATVAEVPEVKAALARLRVVARDLDAVTVRARAASRRAIELALSAPQLVRAAAREVWQGGPSPERDATLRRLEQIPEELKARAERIRAEVVSLPLRADGARKRILEALRVRNRRLARTDRLLAV